MKTSEAPSSGAQSLERALALLKLVAGRNRDGVRLATLVELSELQKPTAHRLLKQLVASELLMQSADKSYHLGQFAYELGVASTFRFPVRDICAPFLERIAQETGDSAFLVVRSHSDSFCVDRKMGSYPIQVFSVEIGHRQPLGVGGGGLALLSALPNEEIEKIVNANAERLSSYGNMTVDKLRQQIADTRERGYAVISNHAIPGVTGVGRAIVDGSGTVVGAISVSSISQRMEPQRQHRVQQILKHEISALLVALARRK
ncbi:IclR family transcriptional regulator [Noviherbaspirillum sp. CPCC 100848]|uniref:IclR family transcriptional regulator n=1 Tax=Noviherbaspirillum album TaxID=3080276 RepID=A0ABU6JIE8_9BURK|nr:IclR family transcriptional regulator [Noviherbaspirillum sp. CPCC 100848]MEC4723473.1 IclR family transcriptional regulator [Noviherbaspirillum sp. CPCC 100848]